jgi:hypothetical protein
MTMIAVAAGVTSLVAPMHAATAADMATFIAPREIQWVDAPPALPRGAKLAVLQGDPAKPGFFVLRLSMPAGYKIGPHWHSQDESLTVISGTFYIGMGEQFDPSRGRGLAAGGFHYLPAKTRHFAFAKKPTVVQVSGNGPFDITYLNPADDPRKNR